MNPLISAICVSHSSRFGLLQRAVLNFSQQRYVEKELIIVVSEPGYLDQVRSFLNRPELLKLIGSTVRQQIRTYLYKFRQPAEALAHAVAWAKGEWIVAWDDDNLSHPDRLAYQLSRSEPGLPSFLMESLYYFYDSDELFVTRYAQPTGAPAERCAVSSLMFNRDEYQPFDQQSRGCWTQAFMDKLASDRRYDLIYGDPAMFLVGSNGDNFRGRELHRQLGSSLPGTLSRDSLIAQQETLVAKLRAYTWHKSTITVAGKDASAFEVSDLMIWPLDWLDSPLPPEDWKMGIPSRELSARLQAEKAEQAAVKAS